MDTGDVGAGSDLADELSGFARSLNGSSDVGRVAERIVEAAVRLVPGADSVSVSVVGRSARIDPLAQVGALASILDSIQREIGTGPCLDAARSGATILVEDLGLDQRWPELALRAAGSGVRGVLVLSLHRGRSERSTLNIYGSNDAAFDDHAVTVALNFGAHAAVALDHAKTVSQLTEALHSRELIGQAKGILMERYKVTGDGAFRLMAQRSQDANVKVQELAEGLVSHGDFFTRPRSIPG